METVVTITGVVTRGGKNTRYSFMTDQHQVGDGLLPDEFSLNVGDKVRLNQFTSVRSKGYTDEEVPVKCKTPSWTEQEWYYLLAEAV